MQTLRQVTPTPEQLKLITSFRDGVFVIRGAAGSGKTTTALLRLQHVCAVGLSRKKRLAIKEPLRVLVITFNRTLRGYISDISGSRIKDNEEINLEIKTFARWAMDITSPSKIVDSDEAEAYLQTIAVKDGLDPIFTRDEVDYVLGRFSPENLPNYLTCEREGRGAFPRCGIDVRKKILENIIPKYVSWKAGRGVIDWNDLALRVLSQGSKNKYNVLIADESQDFSACQIRALMSVMEDTSSVTFILDGAQKIYPRGFTWKEAGVTVQPNQSHRLMENYRNTKQIAALAVSILDGLIIGDDGTLPNLDKCAKEGELPIVLYGKFSAQALWCIKRIEEQIDLATETVAFLHPKGGKWFDFLRGELRKSGIPYVEITKKSEWPEGPENVVLSTMASAKGLEFDHVFIIGLNEEVTPHGAESDDSQMNVLRRLLAMAITRARKTIAIGAKREGASKLFTYLKGGSFREVKL